MRLHCRQISISSDFMWFVRLMKTGTTHTIHITHAVVIVLYNNAINVC